MNKIYSKKFKKNNTKSYTKTKQVKSKQVNMASKLIYDVKGKVGGVEKSYYEMSDDEILDLMKKNMENNHKIKSKIEIKKLINYFLKEF